jgi:predicted aspartyl protease
MRVARLAACLILVSALRISPAWTQSNSGSAATQPPLDIQVYVSADETSETVGVISPGESITPLAEVQGTGGLKWYLVKIKTGAVGWIKQSDDDHAKKVDTFFKSLPKEATATAVAIPNISSSLAPSGAIIVPVQMSGTLIIVPVTVNQSTPVYMALDTGATVTMITRRIATSLRLPTSGQYTLIGTANGAVSAAVGKLSSLAVGTAEVKDLMIVIHDFTANPYLGGLLGLNFLRRYQVSLDPTKQVLVLTPR